MGLAAADFSLRDEPADANSRWSQTLIRTVTSPSVRQSRPQRLAARPRRHFYNGGHGRSFTQTFFKKSDRRLAYTCSASSRTCDAGAIVKILVFITAVLWNQGADMAKTYAPWVEKMQPARPARHSRRHGGASPGILKLELETVQRAKAHLARTHAAHAAGRIATCAGCSTPATVPRAGCLFPRVTTCRELPARAQNLSPSGRRRRAS